MLFLVVGLLAQPAWAGDTVNDTVEVYKDPTCTCCNAWVTYMRQAGYTVNTHDTTDMTAIKQKYHVPPEMRSCHTGVVRGRVLEGHVTVSSVKKMLAGKKSVKGVAVPGMVVGSPGMEGSRVDPYNVMAFDEQGNTEVLERH
ncbi:MAG: DUF411 domain-containing protein [Deltaproteobacteria bacterium]|nr:DUF411 domain-containing protein [Deltaproteobacteria bacterium]